MCCGFQAEMMRQFFLLPIILLLGKQEIIVSAQARSDSELSPCTDPKALGGVLQNGCLVQTCKSGKVEESLAEECVELIEKRVEEILEEKLKGIECPDENPISTQGVLIAGGIFQTKAKLVKLDTKEVCDLPDLPSYFSWSSMSIVNGIVVICGSESETIGEYQLKNETEKRPIHAAKSCIQLSPASKEAQWTVLTDQLTPLRYQVSFQTSDGVLLMGGSYTNKVLLLKPDGTIEPVSWSLQRNIDQGCGIEDDGTIIITGGGSFYKRDAIPTTTVDRYDREGFYENLPDMNVARKGHGCGILQKDGKKVLVVAGGYHRDSETISSVEMLVVGSYTWTITSDGFPPGKMYGMGSVSVNNKIYLTCVFAKSIWPTSGFNIVVYEFDGEKWKDLGFETSHEPQDFKPGSTAVAVDLSKSGYNQFCT